FERLRRRRWKIWDDSGESNELVDQALEQLLTAADVLGGVSLGEYVGLEVGEAGLAGLGASGELGIPALVTLLNEGSEPAVGDDGARDLQAPGEGIHPADVGVEEIDRFEALAADLGVEVNAAGGEAFHAQDAEHAL